MNRDVFFMPLGGGQRVGASCYFLRLGSSNILLDAGIGKQDQVVFDPDFYSLLTSPFAQSMNQINQIYISHAHMDHVGYLAKLMKEAAMASVYMTDMTKLLASYQIYDRNYIGNQEEESQERERLAVQHLLEKVVTVSYLKPFLCGQYRVTFYPAGHIPGAAMMLFEYKNRRILYTGDYSLDSTPLTGGCMLPKDTEIDTLILCGLHAKHPDYRKKTGALYQMVASVYDMVLRKRKYVLCRVQQLSKGIEFIKILNNWNEASREKIEIYIDASVLHVLEKLERLSIPIFTEHNHLFTGEVPRKPHVLVTARKEASSFLYHENLKVDFSLHEDFDEMKAFIKTVNPKQAVLVHCAKEEGSAYTIEQELMQDVDCRTQFLFAEEKEIYKL